MEEIDVTIFATLGRGFVVVVVVVSALVSDRRTREEEASPFAIVVAVVVDSVDPLWDRIEKKTINS